MEAGAIYLASLESESIHIIREVVAEARNPVMLFHIERRLHRRRRRKPNAVPARGSDFHPKCPLPHARLLTLRSACAFLITG